MIKYAYFVIALTISASTYAQNQIDKNQKLVKFIENTRFFIDGNEADILVAKLIDPSNYATVVLGGISAGDMTVNRHYQTNQNQ